MSKRTLGQECISMPCVNAPSHSSAATRGVWQPLDVLKIRFQLQVENRAERKYTNVVQALAKIFKEEGAGALWKGHMPAQYLSIMYGVCQFTVFEVLTKSLYVSAPWTSRESLR